MTRQDREKEHLLTQIEALLGRSVLLADAPECWEQRLYIDFELILLFRRFADLFDAGQTKAGRT